MAKRRNTRAKVVKKEKPIEEVKEDVVEQVQAENEQASSTTVVQAEDVSAVLVVDEVPEGAELTEGGIEIAGDRKKVDEIRDMITQANLTNKTVGRGDLNTSSEGKYTGRCSTCLKAVYQQGNIKVCSGCGKTKKVL